METKNLKWWETALILVSLLGLVWSIFSLFIDGAGALIPLVLCSVVLFFVSNRIYTRYERKLENPEFNIFNKLSILDYGDSKNFSFSSPRIGQVNPYDIDRCIDEIVEALGPADKGLTNLEAGEEMDIEDRFRLVDSADNVERAWDQKRCTHEVRLDIDKTGCHLTIYGDPSRSSGAMVYGSAKAWLRNDHDDYEISRPEELIDEWDEIIFTVAGYQYHAAPKVEKKISTGQLVYLQHDPGNKYSNTAIKVILDKSMIGFVRDDLSEAVYDCLQKKERAVAFILSYDRHENDYHKIKCKLIKESALPQKLDGEFLAFK